MGKVRCVVVVLAASWLSAPEIWVMDLGERRDFGKSQMVEAVGAVDGRRWYAGVTTGLEELAKGMVMRLEGTKLVKADFEEVRNAIYAGLTR